jgi:hypothetical protein
MNNLTINPTKNKCYKNLVSGCFLIIKGINENNKETYYAGVHEFADNMLTYSDDLSRFNYIFGEYNSRSFLDDLGSYLHKIVAGLDCVGDEMDSERKGSGQYLKEQAQNIRSIAMHLNGISTCSSGWNEYGRECISLVVKETGHVFGNITYKPHKFENVINDKSLHQKIISISESLRNYEFMNKLILDVGDSKEAFFILATQLESKVEELLGILSKLRISYKLDVERNKKAVNKTRVILQKIFTLPTKYYLITAGTSTFSIKNSGCVEKIIEIADNRLLDKSEKLLKRLILQ